LVDPRLQLLGKLVVFVAHGYVLIGAELLCKGGNQSTEYGVRRGGVSECKGANRPEACAKVQRLMAGLQSTEYRVQSAEDGGKVGAWLRRALVLIGGQGGALPLPASVAIPYPPNTNRYPPTTARSANPTRYN
jgi:hypothetical protein